MAKYLIAIAPAVLLLSMLALANADPPLDRSDSSQATDREAPDDFLPTHAVMDTLLRRWTHEVAAQYNFDAHQQEKATSEIIRRWRLFFDANRDSIQPLFLEYVQLRMHTEPLDQSHIRDWAQRASPIFARLRNHMEHGVAALRDVLKPHQRARFEKQVQAFRGAMNDATARLVRLERGTIGIEDFLNLFEQPVQRFQQPRSQHARANRNMAPQVADDRVELEIHAWRTYVASFIRAHNLDPGQRTTATSLLSEMYQRASDHRDARRDEIDAVELKIESFSGGKDELTELKKELLQLYGPFDAMFRELETRLLLILTAQQRTRIPRTTPALDDSPARSRSGVQGADSDNG